MTTHKQQLDDIREIRNLMERSSRFLSLSGLSGVFAGVYGLLGAAAAKLVIVDEALRVTAPFDERKIIIQLSIIAVLVLFFSLVTGYYFSWRKAKREKLSMWDSSAKRMLYNLFIPLVAGGVFCIALVYHEAYFLVAPATLLFYGLALINCSKYTLDELRYLGILEIVLGLAASFLPGNGLVFWVIGFGALHIVYGTLMYIRYERK